MKDSVRHYHLDQKCDKCYPANGPERTRYPHFPGSIVYTGAAAAALAMAAQIDADIVYTGPTHITISTRGKYPEIIRHEFAADYPPRETGDGGRPGACA